MSAVTAQYAKAVQALREGLGCDFVAVALVHGGERPLLTWDYGSGSLNGGYRRVVVSPGEGIAGRVYESGEAMVVQWLGPAPPFNGLPGSVAEAEGLESLAALPLVADGRVEGVLLAAWRSPGRMDAEAYARLTGAVCPVFCGYDVPDPGYHRALTPGWEEVSVPMHEVLSDQVIRAGERERERIARELRDGVVQDMLDIQMLLRTVKYQRDWGELVKTVRRAETELGELQRQVLDMALGMRPPEREDMGLAEALRTHFRSLSDDRGVTVGLVENVADTRYPHSVETVFYRVCQEAVENACKYAGCPEICVSLFQAGGQLVLEVTDSGVGFDPDGPERRLGVGLRSMAERAGRIGAELTLDAAPGQGVTVRLSLELGDGGGR